MPRYCAMPVSSPFLLMLAIALSVGGIVEIVPLFYLKGQAAVLEDEITNADGSIKFPELATVRPYTALELAGRDIYIREGCYLCHSQMIRPFRDELERYGHFSLSVESKYDHPFQWGSKRTGPDLARVGGKYSDEWHYQHMMKPRSVVKESVMPNYPWLIKKEIDGEGIMKRMKAMKTLNVPYTDAEINAGATAVKGKTEMDAIIAYLQVLGTMIKFDDHFGKPEQRKNYRE